MSNNYKKFQTREEFETFSQKAVSVKPGEVPVGAECVGEFYEDRPDMTYTAKVFCKDNKYYLLERFKEWSLD